jgi:large subunit ribosomal protein L25
MDFAQLAATVRKPEGKGAARRLRGSGKIPAICYGGGMTSTSLAVSPHELTKILKGPHGRNTVIQMKIEGQQQLLVMLRDFQRHPIARSLLHADFVQVKLDEEILVEVPLTTTGKPAGVLLGGNLNVVYRRVPVYCKPDKIPVQLSVDVTELGMGDGVTAAKMVVPEGVRIALDQNQTIVSVTAPEKEPTPEETAAAEGAVPAEGAAAEGAPAAAGAAPGAPGAAPGAAGAKGAPGAAAAPAGGDKKEAGGKKEKK